MIISVLVAAWSIAVHGLLAAVMSQYLILLLFPDDDAENAKQAASAQVKAMGVAIRSARRELRSD